MPSPDPRPPLRPWSAAARPPETQFSCQIDWKALSQRIGHADVAFTMKQYVQTDLEADRQVANTLAQPVIGGTLASIEITHEAGEGAA